MKFLDLAKNRYSSRKYKKEKVEKEIILQILEAGRIAPSAANRQPWTFVVVDDNKTLDDMSIVYNRDWFKEAPVLFVVCGNKNEAWVRQLDNKNHLDIDISIAATQITL